MLTPFNLKPWWLQGFAWGCFLGSLSTVLVLALFQFPHWWFAVAVGAGMGVLLGTLKGIANARRTRRLLGHIQGVDIRDREQVLLATTWRGALPRDPVLRRVASDSLERQRLRAGDDRLIFLFVIPLLIGLYVYRGFTEAPGWFIAAIFFVFAAAYHLWLTPRRFAQRRVQLLEPSNLFRAGEPEKPAPLS